MNATHEGQDAADVLERAADIIVERGKANAVYSDPAGRVCVMRAIELASGMSCVEAALSTPCRLIDDFTGRLGVPAWNDSNDAPTVIAGLRAVAATLRAQQAAPVAEMVEAL